MDAAPNPAWTLDELSREVERLLRRTGLFGAQGDARVSAAPDARTVRYYTSLGLLDRPHLEGRAARYGARHLLQLFAIKALQAESLGLAEIQQRLYGRTDAELQALADQLAARASQIAPPLPAFRQVIEVPLEPGLKLVFEEGWAPSDPAVLEQQFRAVLAALAKGPGGGKGGK